MSRAIGALAVGGVGAAVAASNSLYTGESTSKIHNISCCFGFGFVILIAGLFYPQNDFS